MSISAGLYSAQLTLIAIVHTEHDIEMSQTDAIQKREEILSIHQYLHR
jgi:hypothetical protein